MTDRQIIRRYLAGTVRAKDGRGHAQNERACFEALLPNTTPTIAMMTAQAVRAVGEAIARRAYQPLSPAGTAPALPGPRKGLGYFHSAGCE